MAKKLMKNCEALPISCLTLSLLIFSVWIPWTQGKISDVKERRATYSYNLLSAQFHQAIGIISTTTWSALDVLRKSNGIESAELRASLEKVQKLYIDQAKISATNYYFLETEPVTDDDKSNKDRYNKIKSDIMSKSDLLSISSDLFLKNFNKQYINDLKFWERMETLGYVLAILMQILGVWFTVKNSALDDILNETKNISSRLNVLTNTKNKKKNS